MPAPRTYDRPPGAAWLVVLALLVVGCAAESPEVEIRRLIERAERAAEAEDLGELSDLVSERYADEAGRDRAALLALVRAYLAHGGSLHLLTRVEKPTLVQPRRAELTVWLAATSVSVSGVLELESVSADLLRVELVVERERGGWKLVRAEWAPAKLTDFLR